MAVAGLTASKQETKSRKTAGKREEKRESELGRGDAASHRLSSMLFVLGLEIFFSF